MCRHLCHSNRSFLGEGVVVEVEHSELGVVLHGVGQSGHSRVVDAVLRHVDFLQTAHQLWPNRFITFIKAMYEQFHCCGSETLTAYGVRSRHLKGLSQCCGSVVLQPVPSCDEDLQPQRDAELTRLFMALCQGRCQDLNRA